MLCFRSHPWSAAIVFALATFFAGFRLGRDSAPSAPGQGYYIHKSDSVFYREALKTPTDKVTTHSYEDAYTKYFELMPRRHTVKRLFEIGLGCNMNYGPGASTRLWRRYMPKAVIWQAEFDAACVTAQKQRLDAEGVSVVTGDQSDLATLRRWVAETGGDFDVVIDDGGHTSMQQYNSFLVLFQHALRPGGAYFLEDLQISRSWVDGDRQHIMIDVIKEWIEGLVMQPRELGNDYTPRFPLPPGVKSIECSPAVCVFIKCYANDERCDTPATDHRLANYTGDDGVLPVGPHKGKGWFRWHGGAGKQIPERGRRAVSRSSAVL